MDETAVELSFELIRHLWRPSYRAWFPAGKDDREATALRVVIDSVNYWEPPRSRVLRLFQAVKAIVGRRRRRPNASSAQPVGVLAEMHRKQTEPGSASPQK
jgi:hypothetical protein